ncbi:hypothetical protein [Heyndrickxia sporothermodurans]|uniref:Uncharacterized protein n=1 Tax=Heyndrickxia sporothermodurans TaxID=46224 RepID=A0A150KVN4_9BACI|nr:hypothetical protein [Heyndrickxia sporothermodurans]KYD03482.1 hypothetical protein B4102_3400 [Heyndrickxia sporothermodurans]MBL5768018.1 hypothetical protein [Heyndrickxia sporothermodurans]MBL5771612.1 hypothetical protein [Heyndrickxia sporothermodurans]MBL5785898.1 hypothetical protein [Heyndrickxia sporothermodurans]MBL5789404.1 hypothetical protein [Heyndrickxia sporothermodurans]
MAVLLITYDLNKPGQNYEKLYETIKSFGPWAHYLESTWFVETNFTKTQVREKLKTVLDKNDHFFICTVKDYDGWADKKLWEWLKKRV